MCNSRMGWNLPPGPLLSHSLIFMGLGHDTSKEDNDIDQDLQVFNANCSTAKQGKHCQRRPVANCSSQGLQHKGQWKDFQAHTSSSLGSSCLKLILACGFGDLGLGTGPRCPLCLHSEEHSGTPIPVCCVVGLYNYPSLLNLGGFLCVVHHWFSNGEWIWPFRHVDITGRFNWQEFCRNTHLFHLHTHENYKDSSLSL